MPGCRYSNVASRFNSPTHLFGSRIRAELSYIGNGLSVPSVDFLPTGKCVLMMAWKSDHAVDFPVRFLYVFASVPLPAAMMSAHEWFNWNLSQFRNRTEQPMEI